MPLPARSSREQSLRYHEFLGRKLLRILHARPSGAGMRQEDEPEVTTTDAKGARDPTGVGVVERPTHRVPRMTSEHDDQTRRRESDHAAEVKRGTDGDGGGDARLVTGLAVHHLRKCVVDSRSHLAFVEE